MDGNGSQWGMMDLINILGFVMGVMNYNENIDQSTLQQTAKNIMQDIHAHLKEQDEKIDMILDKLGKDGV